MNLGTSGPTPSSWLSGKQSKVLACKHHALSLVACRSTRARINRTHSSDSALRSESTSIAPLDTPASDVTGPPLIDVGSLYAVFDNVADDPAAL
ncbi:hypothetical protein GUJ93_ZPchr0002g23359 [Zizania palustris]|uniref:Uncharacterized protein n=1 Tax=Zizania palustris TaxID=103762 RepID=A0A8J5RJD1_ZIZPA|nr:hypothetical protein GUJ93_ZPchr0002g23359 [Zizania palustris]